MYWSRGLVDSFLLFFSWPFSSSSSRFRLILEVVVVFVGTVEIGGVVVGGDGGVEDFVFGDAVDGDFVSTDFIDVGDREFLVVGDVVVDMVFGEWSEYEDDFLLMREDGESCSFVVVVFLGDFPFFSFSLFSLSSPKYGVCLVFRLPPNLKQILQTPPSDSHLPLTLHIWHFP